MNNSLDITTTLGFYNTYFQLLGFYKTQEDTFEYLNNEVEFILGQKPFKNYEEFRNSIFI